ncbi:hypothetical protein ACHZ98_26950 [Streptomyces sp. MAR4 CNY-716]
MEIYQRRRRGGRATCVVTEVWGLAVFVVIQVVVVVMVVLGCDPTVVVACTSGAAVVADQVTRHTPRLPMRAAR